MNDLTLRAGPPAPKGLIDRRRAALLGAALLWTSATRAHDARSAGSRPSSAERQQTEWGIAGDASDVRRSVTVRMLDAMRFQPDRLELTLGETVRIAMRNTGRTMHELVIGTPQALQAHAELMLKFPGMEHDDPWMAHVAPGRTGQIVWNFNRPGQFEFACLIAGHFQAGMRGAIIVT